jgi:Secretion system C-terminal sorting domain
MNFLRHLNKLPGIIFGIIFNLSFCCLGISQSLFQKTYGNTNEDYGRGICQAADTGFYITGGTNSFDSNTNLYLIKIDKNGELVWSNNVGGSNIDWGYSVISTNDNGVVAFGYTNSFGNGGYDFYLVKSDQLGNILWQKTYGGFDWDLGYSIAEDNIGNLYLAGETYSFGSGNNDGYIIKVDSEGNILWEKTIGSNLFEKISKVIVLNDGTISYAATQEIDSYGSFGEFFVGVLDINGNEIWQKFYDYSDDEMSDIIQLSDNNLLFSGSINPGIFGGIDQYIEKINLFNGELIFSYIHGGIDDDYVKGTIEMNNNDLIVSGTSYPGTFGNGDFVNRRTDNNGVLLAGYTSMGFLGPDVLYDVCNTLANGYAVVGESDSFGGDLNNQVLVCTIDSNNFNINYTGVINVIDNISEIVISNEENATNMLKVFPNPVKDKLNIEFIDSQLDQLIVRDAVGNHIKSFYLKDNNRNLDVSHLKSGFYTIEILQRDKMVYRGKIVKSD